MMALVLAFAIVCLVFSIAGFALGGWACIEVQAFKRSTHKVTFLDPTKEALAQYSEDAEFEAVTQETKEKNSKSNNYDLDAVG